LNQNTTGTAAGLSATLVATSGGTGQSSYAVGDLLFASTTTALSKLADVATGNALISGGVGVAPSYGKIGLTTHVSGTLPIANGGTGSTSTTFVNLATNVSGTLPVANGGTGITSFGAGVATFLGTPSSANLAAAVTNETGSGALVFATSPTLVTPALGTPSSGNLANCTFPTLNQNTTGSAATVTGNATGSTFGFNSGYGSVATAYGCRAWVNFNGTANSNLSGTYSQTGTTVTVTATAHGFITGNSAFLDFTSGTAVDGAYEVTVTGVNTFTVTQASRTTSGNVTVRQNTIRASGNVSSIADNGTGDYTVNFTTAMPDDVYAAVFSVAQNYTTYDAVFQDSGKVFSRSASSVRLQTSNDAAGTASLADMIEVSLSIFR
jgi:hypothetical protein